MKNRKEQRSRIDLVWFRYQCLDERSDAGIGDSLSRESVSRVQDGRLVDEKVNDVRRGYDWS